MRHGVQALEVRQHTLFRHPKNEFFSRNLSQNMPKNTYFLEKYRRSVGGSALEPPVASGGWDSALRPPSCYSHLLRICQKSAFLTLKLF